MSSSSRRTYDTDSITLRRIFAYDLTNAPFSTGFVLTSLTNGVVTFSSPSLMLSTIGISNLPATLSSLEGLTLSTIVFIQSETQSTISSVQGQTLSTVNQVVDENISTVNQVVDENISTVNQLVNETRSTVSANTLEFSSVIGDFENAFNSSFSTFFGFLPSSQQFTLPSTVTGLGSSGYVSTSYLTSTIIGLGSLGYLSSLLIDNSLKSTVEGLGSLGYVSSSQLQSSVIGLGSVGYISSSQFLSSIDATTFQLKSSIDGTVNNLGSLGYVSSSTLDSQLSTTVNLLGSSGYVSTLSLISTTSSLSFYIERTVLSTISALGTYGYVSTAQLTSSLRSSIIGLGTVGYISSASLTSTVNLLGSRGYISSQVSTIRSSFSNLLAGNYFGNGFLFENLQVNSSTHTFSFDLGDGMRDQINLSTTNLDIEFKANAQLGYFDSQSGRYDFSTCLVRGSVFNTQNIIGQENYSYYILNANPINLSFFFRERFRFIINDINVISTLKTFSTAQTSYLNLFHYISLAPTTNQFFASPAQPTSITVVLDNATRNGP